MTADHRKTQAWSSGLLARSWTRRRNASRSFSRWHPARHEYRWAGAHRRAVARGGRRPLSGLLIVETRSRRVPEWRRGGMRRREPLLKFGIVTLGGTRRVMESRIGPLRDESGIMVRGSPDARRHGTTGKRAAAARERSAVPPARRTGAPRQLSRRRRRAHGVLQSALAAILGDRPRHCRRQVARQRAPGGPGSAVGR